MFIITFDNLNSNSPSSLAYKQPMIKNKILTTVEELKRRNNIDRILQRRNREQHLENMRKYYQDIKEKYKQYNKKYNKEYYLNNKEYFEKYYKEYYIKNEEYFDEYYQKRKERYREWFKEWYKHNSEIHKNRFKEWYQKNEEKLLESKKEYYKNVETISCGCGKHKKYNRKQHEITKRHQKWEEEN